MMKMSEKVKNIILQNQELFNNNIEEFLIYAVNQLTVDELIELIDVLQNAGILEGTDLLRQVSSI